MASNYSRFQLLVRAGFAGIAETCIPDSVKNQYQAQE